MKVLAILLWVLSLFMTSQAFARTAFDQAVDTAIENQKESSGAQNMGGASFPGREHSQQERDEYLNQIKEKIPTPKPVIDNSSSNLYQKNSTNIMLAESANCTPWNKQFNGCYERVCCCDNKGQHWCERCCPDSSGKCIASRVKC